jgi:hypothetical protein
MSLDVVIGLVGVIATTLVVVGMILITPHGAETSHRAETSHPPTGDARLTPAKGGKGEP